MLSNIEDSMVGTIDKTTDDKEEKFAATIATVSHL